MTSKLFDYSKIRDLVKILQKKRVRTDKCIEVIEQVMPTHDVDINWSDEGKIRKCTIVQKTELRFSLLGHLRSLAEWFYFKRCCGSGRKLLCLLMKYAS